MNQPWKFQHLSDLPCERDWMLDDTGWSPHAWMSDVDLRIIETALARLSARRRSLMCFEWGSGRSTLHFSELLRHRRSLSAWMSVEYNREWFERFRAESQFGSDYHVHNVGQSPSIPQEPTGTHFLVYDYGELLPMQKAFAHHRTVRMDDYVNSIALFNAPFDFVLVDGRKRNQCLFAASQRLRESGIVFLHDAWRPYYAVGGTFFRTALRAGENLMVASHLPLSALVELVDIADLCTEQEIQWCPPPGAPT